MVWEGWERKGETPCVDPVVCDMAVPETRARLSNATFCWTLFRFLRKQNHNVPRPTIATNATPPTTPPAIAPASDFEFPVDVGLAWLANEEVDDGDNELEMLVLVVIADEVVKVSLASDDQEFSFHRSQTKFIALTLFSSYYAEAIICLWGEIYSYFLYALLSDPFTRLILRYAQLGTTTADGIGLGNLEKRSWWKVYHWIKMNGFERSQRHCCTILAPC